MPDSKDENQKPIVSPGTPPIDRLRIVLSALAAYFWPIGGFITTLANDVVPTGAERQRKAWEGAISERTNDHTVRLREHDALLQPQENLEGPAEALVVALAKHCPNGLGSEEYNLAALAPLCPDLSQQELADAISDLKALGLVRKEHLDEENWYIKLTEQFYEQVDDQVMAAEH